VRRREISGNVGSYRSPFLFSLHFPHSPSNPLWSRQSLDVRQSTAFYPLRRMTLGKMVEITRFIRARPRANIPTSP